MGSGIFSLRASVLGAASVVGYKEHQGPLGALFD